MKIRIMLKPQQQKWHHSAEPFGFSLVEVLIGLLIFSLVVSGSLVAFGMATGGIFKTGRIANANAAIDSDIGKLKKLVEDYSACVNPLGSILPDCRDSEGIPIPAGSSWYYQPGTEANFTLFYNACRSTNQANHITKNLIDLINALNKNVGSGVTRSSALREQPSNPNNYLIVINYQHADTNLNRTTKIMPILSAWCP